MGISDKLFGKKKKGGNCAACGKKLLELESGPGPLFGAAHMDFTQVVGRIGLELQRPGYVCEDCGATICRGCITLGELPTCPKCGSKSMKSLL